MLGRLIVSLAGIVCLSVMAPPARAQLAPPPSPEAASGLTAKTLVVAKKQMVVAANPLAARAGLEILQAGGTAVDAAIAVQLVLNVVEPQSSGLGGGAFLLHWDAARRRLVTYDGREAAPRSATPTQFLQQDGKPLPFKDALHGGISTGVPGVVRLLQAAHKAHGRLPWARLFAPAIKLAEDGFPVSQRLHDLIAGDDPANFDAESRAYLYDAKSAPWPVGYTLKNPALAATFRTLADKGADAFYAGPIADAVVRSVTSAPRRPSGMTTADLSAYRAKTRPPICTHYRRHRVCGMGPPSSAALTIGATLTMLEPSTLGLQAMTPRALHLIAEAEKLAYADRDRYIADPDTTPVPIGMLDRAYLARRRSLIDAQKSMTKAEPGSPPGLPVDRRGRDATAEVPGTTHISIIDARGNAVAMTTTIEYGFGAHRMAAGFLLNNQLTDFSFRAADDQGRPVANAVAPRKRPRSSMAPTFVFAPDARLEAIAGSAGGSAIILHVVKTIVGLVDWRLNAQQAVDLANFGSRNGPFEIEEKVAGKLLGLQMARYGDKVVDNDAPSGLHVIVRRADGTLEGGADPRREGVALGD